MSLYPVFATPIIAEDYAAQPTFKQSLCFDQEKGDLVVDGGGRIVLANGHDAWIQWCNKALATERSQMMAYSNDYGVEFVAAMDQSDRASKEAMLSRTIKEALMADPAKRTADVRSFLYVWSDDGAEVSFEIIGSDGYTGELTVTA